MWRDRVPSPFMGEGGGEPSAPIGGSGFSLTVPHVLVAPHGVGYTASDMPEPQQDYKRVELVWPGKRTQVERVKLPFQVIERVNEVRRSEGGQGRMLGSDLPEW